VHREPASYRDRDIWRAATLMIKRYSDKAIEESALWSLRPATITMVLRRGARSRLPSSSSRAQSPSECRCLLRAEGAVPGPSDNALRRGYRATFSGGGRPDMNFTRYGFQVAA
jgi:hypothetical protein